MVESSMEDETGRPIRFSPGWPPMKPEKPIPRAHPGASMVFRKSSWPPPTADEISELTGENTNDSPALNSTDANQNNPSQTAPAQNNNSSAQTAVSNEKPKRVVKDYSSFYGKNAAPPAKPAYIFQPGGIKIPDKFSGTPDAEDV